MKYSNVYKGKFISRPNRFIAQVEINGNEETVHVKNTGRCKELLLPGVTVYLAKAENPDRKTQYDLIGVEKYRGEREPLSINMDSQAANDVAEEWLKKGLLFSKEAHLRREVRHGKSRFDFYIEDGGRKAFLEVKGVTLEHEGVALFPDAPTERGVKHVRELIDCIQEGYEAYILFVVQMKEISLFRPNDDTHEAFGEALRQARDAGVQILAVDCIITPDTMEMDASLPVEL